jgi:hypothetical protein
LEKKSASQLAAVYKAYFDAPVHFGHPSIEYGDQLYHVAFDFKWRRVSEVFGFWRTFGEAVVWPWVAFGAPADQA